MTGIIHTIRGWITAGFTPVYVAVMLALIGTGTAGAQPLAGTPLNGSRNFQLGSDLGFGHRYSPSLGQNYQDWGAQIVTLSDGYPVRLGERSIRFETREGSCGWDEGWSDCQQGRNRHELSSSGDRDPAETDLWFALSFYLPEAYDVPRTTGNSIFQLWSGGRDSFQFKYKAGAGFIAQRKLDDHETILVPAGDVHGRWIDVLMQARYSMRNSGALLMWVDGKKAYDYYGRTTAGTDPNAPNYFKFGIYNTAFGTDGAPIGPRGNGDGAGLPDLHLFFDEVRFARDCASLALGDLGYDCADFAYDGADPAQVSLLQTALNRLGCDVGPVDGIAGRRTAEAALNCRQFSPGELPDTVSVNTVANLASLYTSAAEQDMPDQPRPAIIDALSEFVGGNNDNALSVEARVGTLDIDIILIGHFDDSGVTDWFSILFKDNLSADEANGARQCPGVTIQTWGDASNHLEVQFNRNARGEWTTRASACLRDELPPATMEELTYLLANLKPVAAQLVAEGFRGEAHDGLARFIELVAAGEIMLGED